MIFRQSHRSAETLHLGRLAQIVSNPAAAKANRHRKILKRLARPKILVQRGRDGILSQGFNRLPDPYRTITRKLCRVAVAETYI